jgi:hypothetical protein
MNSIPPLEYRITSKTGTLPTNATLPCPSTGDLAPIKQLVSINPNNQSNRHYEKIHFGNGHIFPLVTGNAPVTDQVLQISQER